VSTCMSSMKTSEERRISNLKTGYRSSGKESRCSGRPRLLVQPLRDLGLKLHDPCPVLTEVRSKGPSIPSFFAIGLPRLRGSFRFTLSALVST